MVKDDKHKLGALMIVLSAGKKKHDLEKKEKENKKEDDKKNDEKDTKKYDEKINHEAREGKDLGKKGKNFDKIANKAGKEYGSEEAGKRVAGSIFQKMKAKKEL